MFRSECYSSGFSDDQTLGAVCGRAEGLDRGQIHEHEVDFASSFQNVPQEHRQSVVDEQALWYPSAAFNAETAEQKKRRKNREAAARCQRRKKEQTEILRADVEYLQHLVDQMKTAAAAAAVPIPMATIQSGLAVPMQTTQASLSPLLPGLHSMMPSQQMQLPPLQPGNDLESNGQQGRTAPCHIKYTME